MCFISWLFKIFMNVFVSLPSEQAGHAKSLITSYDLSQIDGIVVSSGDGLVYEVSALAQTHTHTHTHTHAHALFKIFMNVFVSLHIHTHIHTCTHTCTHIHTCTHTCTHMYTKLHMCKYNFAPVQCAPKLHLTLLHLDYIAVIFI